MPDRADMTPADDVRTVLDPFPWLTISGVNPLKVRAARRNAEFLSPQRPEAVGEVPPDGTMLWCIDEDGVVNEWRCSSAFAARWKSLVRRKMVFTTQLDALRALACDLTDEYLAKRAEIERQIAAAGK